MTGLWDVPEDPQRQVLGDEEFLELLARADLPPVAPEPPTRPLSLRDVRLDTSPARGVLDARDVLQALDALDALEEVQGGGVAPRVKPTPDVEQSDPAMVRPVRAVQPARRRWRRRLLALLLTSAAVGAVGVAVDRDWTGRPAGPEPAIPDDRAGGPADPAGPGVPLPPAVPLPSAASTGPGPGSSPGTSTPGVGQRAGAVSSNSPVAQQKRPSGPSKRPSRRAEASQPRSPAPRTAPAAPPAPGPMTGPSQFEGPRGHRYFVLIDADTFEVWDAEMWLYDSAGALVYRWQQDTRMGDAEVWWFSRGPGMWLRLRIGWLRSGNREVSEFVIRPQDPAGLCFVVTDAGVAFHGSTSTGTCTPDT